MGNADEEAPGWSWAMPTFRNGAEKEEGADGAVGPFSTPKKYVLFATIDRSIAFVFLLHERKLSCHLSIVKRICFLRPLLVANPSPWRQVFLSKDSEPPCEILALRAQGLVTRE